LKDVLKVSPHIVIQDIVQTNGVGFTFRCDPQPAKDIRANATNIWVYPNNDISLWVNA
jgi:hypothetical protein